MGVSRIEQLIEDIYEFIESCKMQPLSQTKVVVPKDELYDLLDELRLRTPDEIKRYQKIIANRDAIIADAEERAQKIQEEAREQAKSLVNDNEIMQQAYYQANEMVSSASAQAEAMLRSAQADAEQIRTGALAYTEEILNDVQNILSNAFEASKANSENLVNSLKVNLDIVVNNKKEITDQLHPVSNSVQEVQEEVAAETTTPEYTENNNTEDYNFDENTFLEEID